jgi:hypothetical protein
VHSNFKTLTKAAATSLLITYMVILFGYGLSSLTHMWLHAVENSAHSHGHSYSNQAGNYDQHSISDHSKALSKLNNSNQGLADTESDSIVFSFVFWKKSESLLFNPHCAVANEPSSNYLVFYNSRSSKPSTPPPLS